MTTTLPATCAHYRYVHDYLAFVRWANATTAAGRTIALRAFNSPALDAAAWRAEFRLALNARINAKGGTTPRSRYCPSDLAHGYNYAGFVRDQHRLSDIRRINLRVYSFETRAVRERFGHLLASWEAPR
jgi:hypothetical protein